ncbi:MAG: endo-1,4-beta-xylanase, partial [Phycisphaerales bacterium]|nr:endo-1,4-beta-xylanase [Phycisphaerales bacterium]
GLRATDRLAHSHADILLHRRYFNRPASSTTLGSTIDITRDPDELSESLDGFDVVTLPLRWRDIEVRRGHYDFTQLDKWMQWAHRQERPVIFGPLANLEADALPEWVEVYRNDYQTLRDMMYDFMEAVVARYVRTVGIWKVTSGLHLTRENRLKPAEMIDLTRTASLLVRQYRRGARTMIEVDDLFGDLAAKRPGSLGAFEYLEQVRVEGIRYDCLGARLHVGGTEPSERTRDIMTISDALDRFFLHEVPLLISACGAPCISMGDSAGSWRGVSWSPERQAEWASQIIPLALSKPYVEAVIWSMHQDRSEQSGFGLLDASGACRPAHEKLLSMRRRLRRPLGRRENPGRGEVHHQRKDG